MSETLGPVAAPLLVERTTALSRRFILNSLSTIPNRLKPSHGCEKAWIGLLESCWKVTNSSSYLNLDAVLDRDLGLDLLLSARVAKLAGLPLVAISACEL